VTRPTLYTADVVLPVAPMTAWHRGAVVVEGERIVAAGPDDDLRRAWPQARRVELPGCALLPGLVDAHTHLTWADLALAVPLEQGFEGWLQAMTSHALGRSPEDIARAAALGARDALARGVTAVGDSGPHPAAAQALAAAGLSGVFHLEVFGPDPLRADEALDALDLALERLAPTPGLRLGLAPHAPYTVSAPLLRGVLSRASARRLPVSLHLAEARAEEDFIRHGRGPLAERLRARGVAVRAHGGSAVEWAADQGVLDAGARVTLVHLVQADERDLARVARSGAAVVACPVSNAVLGHGPPPAWLLAAPGGPRALGTDSAASNPRRDLFDEGRAALAAARAAGLTLDAADVLRLLTLGGAEALEHDGGALAPGRRADLIAVSLPDDLALRAACQRDPIEVVVRTAVRERIRLTVAGGVVRHDPSRLTGEP
jgi:5-methylthioadenosine/S-adenosylhomocysteine deaminase